MSESVQLALIVSAAPTIAAVAGLIVSLKNRNKISQVHQLINSGLTVRIAEAKDLGRLEGKEEERNDNESKK